MTRLLHITTVPQTLLFMRGQIPEMIARGLDVEVVSSPGPALAAFAQEFGVIAHPVEMPRRISPVADLRAVWALWQVMRARRPTIVHAHTPKGGLLGMLAATLHGAPIRVFHMRGSLLPTATGWRRALFLWLERLTCALAHEVICVSPSLRDEALAARVAPPRKLRVLADGSSNGVDALGRFNPARLDAETRGATRARLEIPPQATVIGFVGRLVRDKGIHELVEAWSRLRDRHPDAHLLIVGPFEARDAVPEDLRQRLRDDPRVHLAGFTADTPAMYAAMDLVVLPTYREGFPNVPLEAAAMGLPVVASRVTGCVDAVVDDQTGALVPPRDAEALADAILRYLADPPLRRAHGLAGQRRARERFAPARIWDALHRVYTDQLGQRLDATRHVRGAHPAPG